MEIFVLQYYEFRRACSCSLISHTFYSEKPTIKRLMHRGFDEAQAKQLLTKGYLTGYNESRKEKYCIEGDETWYLRKFKEGDNISDFPENESQLCKDLK